jgi:hypothetical protein
MRLIYKLSALLPIGIAIFLFLPNSIAAQGASQNIAYRENSLIKNINKNIPITHYPPFGNKALVDTIFPETWQSQFGENFLEHSKEKIQVIFDSILSDNRDKNIEEKLNALKNLFCENNFPIAYYDDMVHVFDGNFSTEKSSPIANFRFNNNINVTLFSSKPVILNTGKYIAEYNNYRYQRNDMISSIDGKIIDSLNVYYDTSWSIIEIYKLFYIDKNKIIHIKYFSADEEFTNFIRYDKYKVSDKGKFVKYYDVDGEFENDEEHGFVKNHVREGKWIETRPNGYIRSHKEIGYNIHCTYLEAEYESGIPVNNWKYYKSSQKHADKTRILIPCSKNNSGDLLYMENYEQGKMVSRKFMQ